MTIEITERVQAVWHMEIQGGNWLAAVESLEGGGSKISYRFRYYHDDKLFEDSKDLRHWYRAESEIDVVQAIDKVRQVVAYMQRTGVGVDSHEIVRGRLSLNDFAALLMAQRYMHTKRVQAGTE
jgi:hypothetical protein